ncbi:IPPc domain-containing protein [Aphelenchoides bicaudatus]|nr:IPPc domain-containing protein [Aphelenchoides bicaudatus]
MPSSKSKNPATAHPSSDPTASKTKISIKQKPLKKDEEPITSKKWNILAITYNVSNKPPSQQAINQILEVTMKNTDLSFVMISLQNLQEIKTAERFGMHWRDTWRELFHMALWEMGFICIADSYMITNLLMVFAALPIAQLVENCRFSYSKDYYNGAKGTICALIQLRGKINFIFMGSHFVHATEQVSRRIGETNSVRKLVRLAKPSDGTTAVLWAGDLNFRSTDVSADEFAKTVQKQPAERMKELVEKHDQMAQLDKEGTFGFVDEAPINFMPTYRYIIGSDNVYDLLRVPSWTDRILFDNLRSIKYDSIRDCNYSDHQPVYSHLSFNCEKVPKNGWEIEFNEINAWYVGVPMHICFKGKDFWKKNGSYRDWIGIYKVPNINQRCLVTFTNIMLCIDYGTHYLAECMSLPPGEYIAAYHSYNDSCIKGLSTIFKVTYFE